ncbi:hypothetical protein Pla100_58320 [Neorhodopirellula pilleata]|uniref:Uncharacterized protein n=1 Tax=Neorhodopirellula pilleata TaxID=2714738 RepID=A0A5C5ZN64_9BACT|nr:hypothetical protein Pla100_58320 [Neorhodopirellula pilleata]
MQYLLEFTDADLIAATLADNEMTLDDLRHDVQLLARRQ